ncbi:SDR family NAD(P)-dependent oxidoreductase [Kordiimonas sp. SCSIO 12610]|uniref:SDR family NAD(P)-dependent oxidoreductase n=1 Tax=Kordiimonas sp. SCSIO 12610 TaxID=2829597 RepID=UPI00210D9A89|nr:SDR family oxidoreductase [Kordiimonas sp. SCSIO 12610]UTW55376.1 SDR family oxidoreductase [Kordiimonas sp. SCSIO 12610]
MRFKNKSILITGGTSGLGAAAAYAFASEGAHISFCGLDDKAGQDVEANIRQQGGISYYFPCDVRNEDDIALFVAKTIEQTGKIDIAFNNAGISHSAARFADQDTDVVEDVWRTNVMGVWYSMRHQIKHMLENGGGAIINTASILSKSGAEWMAAYGMTKHAIIGLTKSAALDYADKNIRINAVSPGPMLTPMFKRALDDIGGDMDKFAGGFPKNGPADPAEVAKTILYLASEEASYTNGANIIVDGGASTG